MIEAKNYIVKKEAGKVIRPLPLLFDIGERFYLLNRDNELTLLHVKKIKEHLIYNANNPRLILQLLAMIYRREKDSLIYNEEEVFERTHILLSLHYTELPKIEPDSVKDYINIDSKERFPFLFSDNKDTPKYVLEKYGVKLSIDDTPPHEYFWLLDILSNHDVSKHHLYWNLPIVWLYASANRKRQEEENMYNFTR
jgi:hypothetical protein